MSYKNNNRGERPIITGARVEVKRDDVNGALRKLKKILERDDRQKELAKREYFEKPSITKKRERDAAKRRNRLSKNDFLSVSQRANPTGTKWMKSKRKRRRVLDAQTVYTRFEKARED